ncbi:MAG: hypothetical protein L0099_14200 [Acidobacteria bacterium]|nr:hypothetical protein [Acidobacteriota bacterium]
MKRSLLVIAMLCVCTFAVQAVAQEHYTEGPVWRITLIKVMPNQMSNYLKSLRESTKPLFDEAKKQGVIVDYKVHLKSTSEEDDWDVAVAVQYKNFAALDGLEAKMDAIQEKMGGQSAAQQTAEKRLAMREIVSSFLVREVTLK